MTAPPQVTSTRDTGDAISPTWLNAYVGSRWRYCQAIEWDALEIMGAYAVYCGLPSTAPPDAYQWISSDRQVFQGPSEPAPAFVLRLQRWLDSARLVGTDTGIMLAVLGYLAPLTPEIECVDNAGVWWVYANGQDAWPVGQALPTTPTQTVNANWNWDGLSPPFIGTSGWWRTWLIVFSASGSPWAEPTAVLGGFNLGDGTAINWAGSQNDVQSLRALPKSQKGAHTYVPNVIVSYDNTLFPPGASSGSPLLPDGNYGNWGKVVADATYGRLYVPARTISPASYIDGVRL